MKKYPTCWLLCSFYWSQCVLYGILMLACIQTDECIQTPSHAHTHILPSFFLFLFFFGVGGRGAGWCKIMLFVVQFNLESIAILISISLFILHSSNTNIFGSVLYIHFSAKFYAIFGNWTQRGEYVKKIFSKTPWTMMYMYNNSKLNDSECEPKCEVLSDTWPKISLTTST